VLLEPVVEAVACTMIDIVVEVFVGPVVDPQGTEC